MLSICTFDLGDIEKHQKESEAGNGKRFWGDNRVLGKVRLYKKGELFTKLYKKTIIHSSKAESGWGLHNPTRKFEDLWVI